MALRAHAGARRSSSASVVCAVMLLGLVAGFASVHAPTYALILATAVVAVYCASRYLGPAIEAHSTVAMMLGCVVVTLANFTGLISALPFGQYLPFLFLAALLVRLKPHISGKLFPPTALASVLFAFGFAGSLVGRIYLGNIAAAFPIFIPMILVAFPVAFEDHSTAEEMRRWMKWAGLGCALIVLMIGVAYTYPGLVTPLVFNHEKILLCVVAIGFGIASRSLGVVLAGGLATIFAFLQYPAATYGLVVIAAVVTLAIMGPRFSKSTQLVLCSTFVVVFLLTAFNIERVLKYSPAYFDVLGKTDNSSTRMTIYQSVFATVKDPFISSLFTERLSIQTNIEGKMKLVPAHSDVLTLYVGGGIIAAVLLVSIFGAATYSVARSRRRLTGERYACAVVLVTAANSALFSGLVNPILLNPTTSVIVFACLGTALGIARSTNPTADAAPPRVSGAHRRPTEPDVRAVP